MQAAVGKTASQLGGVPEACLAAALGSRHDGHPGLLSPARPYASEVLVFHRPKLPVCSLRRAFSGEYWDSLAYQFDGTPAHNQDAHRQRIVNWIEAAGGLATAFGEPLCQLGVPARLPQHAHVPRTALPSAAAGCACCYRPLFPLRPLSCHAVACPALASGLGCSTSTGLLLLWSPCPADITTKGIMHAVFERCEYWRLSDAAGKPPGLMGWWPSRAVTFLENHDTGSTQVGAPAGGGRSCSAAASRGAASCATMQATEVLCVCVCGCDVMWCGVVW